MTSRKTNDIFHFSCSPNFWLREHETTTVSNSTQLFRERANFQSCNAPCPISGHGEHGVPYSRRLHPISVSLLRSAGARTCVQYSAGRWRAPEKQTDTICRRWRPRNNRNKNSSKSRTEMSAASTAIAFNLANWRGSPGRRKPNSTLPTSRASIRAPAAAGYPARTNHLPMRLASYSPRS